MKRRKFINHALTGLPVVMLAPALLSTSCSDDESVDKTVVVIGAGISGLAAAKKLKDKGYTVIVLESRDTVGGRLRTNRDQGIAFDEGASWIHGPNGNPITSLASQAGGNTYLTSDEETVVYDVTGAMYPDDSITTTEEEFNKALEAVENQGSQNQSFQTVFNSLYPAQANQRLWKYMLSSNLEFNTGADISMLSSKDFYDDEEFSGADVIVTNGYDRVAQFLANGLDVRLETKVTAIDYSQTKIKITANSNVLEADHVVVSVPLGVLKSGSITFAPALPAEKQDAITRTKMGNVNKFLLIWDSAFWDVDSQYIGFTPETKGKFNYFLNVKKFTPANALMTFAFGDYASITESKSDAEIIRDIMDHLKTMYGNNIPDPVKFARTRWGQDIHTFGAYSYATNGTTTEDFDILASTVDNKLFFAGEHTEREYRGTVHGAYLSGIREADKIVDL